MHDKELIYFLYPTMSFAGRDSLVLSWKKKIHNHRHGCNTRGMRTNTQRMRMKRKVKKKIIKKKRRGIR